MKNHSTRWGPYTRRGDWFVLSDGRADGRREA